MSTERAQHGIGDLARLAGVTPRTIRYYVAQGLLPAPSGTGPGAHYDDRHLERLQLIKRLQRQHLPLAEIRGQLEGLDDEQIADLARADAAVAPPDSALDYIRGLLAPAGPPATPKPPPHAPAPTRPAPAPTRAAGGAALLSRRIEPEPWAALALEPAPLPAPPTSAPSAPASEPAPPPALERSQWERMTLGPNLELHIRRPLSRHEQRRVERLITIARQVLKEEAP